MYVVCEPITSDGQWNKLFLDKLFVKDDVECILTIPLGKSSTIDKWRWFYESSGRYSVRSGYRLALEAEGNHESKGNSSGSHSSSSFWNSLWRLNIPNKIKLFMWKAILDIIPSNFNLFCRKIPTSPICPICQKCEETGLHILWKCNLSKKLWANIGWNFSNTNPSSFSGLFEYVISSLTIEHVELFCYICWLLWNERNNVVHDRCTSTTVASTIEKAYSLLAEFQNANEKIKPEKVDRNARWTAPPVGLPKTEY